MSADAVRKEPTKDPLWLAAAISNRENDMFLSNSNNNRNLLNKEL